MSDCPFCDPSTAAVVVENADFYARPDAFPSTEGHTLIVPRRHITSLWELDEFETASLWKLVAQVREELHRKNEPDGWNIGINQGEAAGQTVEHLHVHLIPRYVGDQPDPRGGIRRGLPDPGGYCGPTVETWRDLADRALWLLDVQHRVRGIHDTHGEGLSCSGCRLAGELDEALHGSADPAVSRG